MKTKLGVVIAALFLVSCGSQTPKRSSPQQVLDTSFVSANKLETDTTPKLDALIVVDNSLSMTKHQNDLQRNIPAFVKDFADNATIDFHFGVLTIWDSDPEHSALVQAKHPLGELLPLQGPNGPVNSTPRYVTRDTPDRDSVLQSTILMGEETGPEFEEMFTPVEAFFQSSSPVNKGFYRPSAHLLIIFLTDANDSSVITAEQFYADMLAVKNNNRDLLHFYSIISPTHADCPKDNAGVPTKFDILTALSDGNSLSLCSSQFGAELAHFGKTLSVDVGRQVIALSGIPDANKPFKVTYGTQEIKPATAPNFNNGYLFDTEKNQIIIPGDLPLKSEAGAKIKIDYTPITADSISHGRVSQKTESAPATAPAQ